MLEHLVPTADRIIFTRPKINRNLDPEILKKVSENLSHVEMQIIDDVGDAVRHAIDTVPDQGTVCIAGSLYVAGEARACILEHYPRSL